MTRKNGLKALLALVSFLPFLTNAQVLGDESVLSTLSQPLQIEIDLLDWQDVNLDQFQVGLASPADFEAFDLDYLNFFNDFDFQIEQRGDQAVIKIGSVDRMSEPYLDFLVRARWPGGSVLREYIVLLDPPLTETEFPDRANAQNQRTVPVQTEVTSAASANTDRAANTSANSSVNTRPASQSSASANRSSGQRSTYRVQPGDTLWSIARDSHPQGSDAILHQTLIALYELNPDAFVAKNITLLKNNQNMTIPSVDDINQYSAAEARRIYELRTENGQARVDALRDGLPLPEFTDFPVRLANENTSPVPVAPAVLAPEPVSEPDRTMEQGAQENNRGLQLAYEDQSVSPVSVDEEPLGSDILGELNLLEILLEEREQEIEVLENQVSGLTSQYTNAQSNVERLTQALEEARAQNASSARPTGQLQQVENSMTTLIFGGLSGVFGVLLVLSGIALFRMKHQLEDQQDELEYYTDDNGQGVDKEDLEKEEIQDSDEAEEVASTGVDGLGAEEIAETEEIEVLEDIDELEDIDSDEEVEEELPVVSALSSAFDEKENAETDSVAEDVAGSDIFDNSLNEENIQTDDADAIPEFSNLENDELIEKDVEVSEELEVAGFQSYTEPEEQIADAFQNKEGDDEKTEVNDELKMAGFESYSESDGDKVEGLEESGFQEDPDYEEESGDEGESHETIDFSFQEEDEDMEFGDLSEELLTEPNSINEFEVEEEVGFDLLDDELSDGDNIGSKLDDLLKDFEDDDEMLGASETQLSDDEEEPKK